MVTTNKFVQLFVLLALLGTFTNQARWLWVADEIDDMREEFHDAMRNLSHMAQQRMEQVTLAGPITVEDHDETVEVSVAVDPEQQEKIKLTQLDDRIKLIAPVKHGRLEMFIKKRSITANAQVEQGSDTDDMRLMRVGSYQISRTFSKPVELVSVNSAYKDGVFKLLLKKQQEPVAEQKKSADHEQSSSEQHDLK